MTYPKKFSEYQKEALRPIVPQIEALAPGESLRLKGTAAGTSSLQYLIYAWLSPEHSDRKDEFLLRRLTSTELLLLRKEKIDISVEKVSKDSEHPLLEYYIDTDIEEELLKRLHDDKVDPKDIVEIHTQWKKIYQQD